MIVDEAGEAIAWLFPAFAVASVREFTQTVICEVLLPLLRDNYSGPRFRRISFG